MKLRTPEEFQDHLDHEYAWRIKEINNITSHVRIHNGPAASAFLRAGVPLLYAHWEGFIKSSAEAFLNHVCLQRKKYNELNVCFSLHGFKTYLDTIGETRKQHLRLDALKFILSGLGGVAQFSWKDKINTESNLNSVVFQSIAAAVGVDPGPYSTRFQLIDEKLLRSRNEIAHGKYLEVTCSSFMTLSDETILLMRRFKDDLQNIISLKSYLAT
jgi:hypothetical protein